MLYATYRRRRDRDRPVTDARLDLSYARNRVRYLRVAVAQAIAWIETSAATEHDAARRAEGYARGYVLRHRLQHSRYRDNKKLWAGVPQADVKRLHTQLKRRADATLAAIVKAEGK